MLSRPRLSTVSNVDWTNVQVGAFKATASTARHHQSQSQSQVKNLLTTEDRAVSGLLRFTNCAGKFQLYGNVKRCENGGSEVNWKQKCNFRNVKGRNQYYQQCMTKVI